jgi:3-deoxy-manno-octulosonate cytidylyltransferase (CMP-KDO synthetase)
VAEVVDRPEYAEFDIIVNVQGDEPFVPAEAVTGAIDRVSGGDDIGTAGALLMAEHAADPNRVKVAVDAGGRAVSFSRSFMPGSHHHQGIYAYRREALLAWVRARPVPEEVAERLEQLRPLALGLNVGVAVLNEPAPPGIDTEEDLQMAEAYLTGVGA